MTRSCVYNSGGSALSSPSVNEEESEKEELRLVEGEAMEYPVKATLETLRTGTQPPASSEGCKVGIGVGLLTDSP